MGASLRWCFGLAAYDGNEFEHTVAFSLMFPLCFIAAVLPTLLLVNGPLVFEVSCRLIHHKNVFFEIVFWEPKPYKHVHCSFVSFISSWKLWCMKLNLNLNLDLKLCELQFDKIRNVEGNLQISWKWKCATVQLLVKEEHKFKM